MGCICDGRGVKGDRWFVENVRIKVGNGVDTLVWEIWSTLPFV